MEYECAKEDKRERNANVDESGIENSERFDTGGLDRDAYRGLKNHYALFNQERSVLGNYSWAISSGNRDSNSDAICDEDKCGGNGMGENKRVVEDYSGKS